MKSMTDFIMEQEMPSVEEEVFNESALVSQFMGMQAAAAEMNCIYEYASIVTFCESNDIEIPEMLVQEGFKDVMNKILTGISNFFKKIADWFKSLVKGTVATFSASKLNEIIAKLKTYPEDTTLDDEKIIAPAIIYVHIVAALEAYREVVIHPIAEGKDVDTANNDDQRIAAEFIKNIDKFCADLEKLKDNSQWKTASGGFNDKFNFDVLGNYLDTGKVDISVPKHGDLTYGWLINVLETVNRLDIPKQGSKILDELGVDVKKFTTNEKVTTNIHVTANAGDEVKTIAANLGVDAKDLTAAININAIKGQAKTISNAGKFTTNFDDDVSMKNVSKWVTNRDVQDKIGKTANLLATVYDKAKTGLSDTAALVFKDLDKASGEDANKDYQKNLSNLNKDTGRDRLSKGNSSFSDETKQKLGFSTK